MKRILLLLILLAGCELPPPPQSPVVVVAEPAPPVEIKDFAVLEVTGKYTDLLNAWLHENPTKEVVAFGCAYIRNDSGIVNNSNYYLFVHSKQGSGKFQRFVHVDGIGAPALQTFLNERPCEIVSFAAIEGGFVLCIEEK